MGSVGGRRAACLPRMMSTVQHYRYLSKYGPVCIHPTERWYNLPYVKCSSLIPSDCGCSFSTTPSSRTGSTFLIQAPIAPLNPISRQEQARQTLTGSPHVLRSKPASCLCSKSGWRTTRLRWSPRDLITSSARPGRDQERLFTSDEASSKEYPVQPVLRRIHIPISKSAKFSHTP